MVVVIVSVPSRMSTFRTGVTPVGWVVKLARLLPVISVGPVTVGRLVEKVAEESEPVLIGKFVVVVLGVVGANDLVLWTLRLPFWVSRLVCVRRVVKRILSVNVVPTLVETERAVAVLVEGTRQATWPTCSRMREFRSVSPPVIHAC